MGHWIATREESEHYHFLFSASSLCPQSTVQVSSADITFENSSDSTKCSCDNACMCSLVSADLIIIVVFN